MKIDDYNKVARDFKNGNEGSYVLPAETDEATLLRMLNRRFKQTAEIDEVAYIEKDSIEPFKMCVTCYYVHIKDIDSGLYVSIHFC